ncbi:MAG: class I SAM-dependent methyltransferase [Nitrospirae bacterium]|nr:class I SAM-dependent methyltransferase [Nitrospirota bacterium]
MNNHNERKKHWDNVYKNKQPDKLSWYEKYPVVSFDMIDATGVGPDANIIDVGGGTSSLAEHLLRNGYRRITVLDIAPSALEMAKERLGDKANDVKWIEADIMDVSLTEDYDVWHDRAVFHFLAGAQDRKRYIDAVKQSLKMGGHIIVATFSIDGPLKCSGLDVVRYSPQTLHNEFGSDFFTLIESIGIEHITPANEKQKFVFCRFKRVR